YIPGRSRALTHNGPACGGLTRGRLPAKQAPPPSGAFGRMFVLAHLSDPHLAGWSVDEIGSLFNKRLTGWLSWWKNRQHIHLSRILDLIVDDVAARNADHIAVTGDLVNISLPQEFARAGQWLRRLGTGERVTVI